MFKTVSATEAKLRLGAVLDWVVEYDDGVIIESRRRPKAVIMSFDEYTKVKEMRQQAQRA